MKTIKILLISIGALFTISSCKDNGPGDTDAQFDRVAMLSEYRDAFIIPAYDKLARNTNKISQFAMLFAENPDANLLDSLQQTWIETALSWQNACFYNFGPAGEVGLNKSLHEEIATFPVSLTKLEAILSSGNWNTSDFNRDARGLYTIEFLLFNDSLGTNQLLEYFQTAKYRNFLLALCNDLNTRVAAVRYAWNSYGVDFVNASGTQAGSSVSQLYNEFVKSYEFLKNYKFGLPLGLRPGQIAVDPSLLEGRFSRIAFRLAHSHFEAICGFYRGADPDKSFKAYLKTVTGGESLVAKTEEQLAVLTAQFNALDENLDMESRILSSPQALIEIHTELQKNTMNFKSEMSSLLGIAITFASSDGD